jgi:hypothetical protein
MSKTNADRLGGWIQTFLGSQFWPTDPRASEIHLADIAHALSNQCRFAGHCKRFYSVAEHSVEVSLVAEHCSDGDLAAARWGLLHDAAEAYLVDLPRPIKYSNVGLGYREAETRVALCVAERFELPWPMPEAVHHADNVLLATEMVQLMASPPAPWEALPKPLAIELKAAPPVIAERAFLLRAEQLGVLT